MKNIPKHSVESISASTVLEIGSKEIGALEKVLFQGIPIKLDKKTAGLIKKDINALPKTAQEKIFDYAKEIGNNLDKPGFADVRPLTDYISGLMDSNNSIAFSNIEDEIPVSYATGAIIVLLIILFALLVLLALKWALFGKIAVDGIAAGPIIIHGSNDPNGPIGPGPPMS